MRAFGQIVPKGYGAKEQKEHSKKTEPEVDPSHLGARQNNSAQDRESQDSRTIPEQSIETAAHALKTSQDERQEAGCQRDGNMCGRDHRSKAAELVRRM